MHNLNVWYKGAQDQIQTWQIYDPQECYPLSRPIFKNFEVAFWANWPFLHFPSGSDAGSNLPFPRKHGASISNKIVSFKESTALKQIKPKIKNFYVNPPLSWALISFFQGYMSISEAITTNTPYAKLINKAGHLSNTTPESLPQVKEYVDLIFI